MSSQPTGWQTPKTNWRSADVPLSTDFNRIEGNIQAIESGSRTLDPSQAPSGNSGSLRQILSWFANRIRAITGASNWYDSPATTLAAAKSGLDNLQSALNTHKSSGDHDGRYYTKSQLNTSGGGGQVHWDNVTGKPELVTRDFLRDVLITRWAAYYSPTTRLLEAVSYANGLWVATGTGTIMYSTDNGFSWTDVGPGGSSPIRGVAYGNGRWIACTNNGHFLYSTNGTTWDSRRVIDGFTNGLTSAFYGNGLWVIVGFSGAIVTSPDGITWTSRSSGTSNHLRSVAYGDGMWVAVGDSGTIRTSTNGTSWTSRSSGTSVNLQGVFYGNGLWVIVGDSGTILTSTNGTSWTKRVSGTSLNLRSVGFGDGLWAVVGDNGVLLTSTNGTSWQYRSSGTTNILMDVYYGDGSWLAVGESGIISRTEMP